MAGTKDGASANEQAQNRLRKKQRIALEQARTDLRDILAMPQGRRFLWSVLEYCGVYRTNYDPPTEYRGCDPIVMAMREGQRNVGLWLTAQCEEASPEQWLNMYAERLEEEARSKREDNSDENP